MSSILGAFTVEIFAVKYLNKKKTRRQAEIRREEEAKKQKREWERDIMRMVEKGQELKLKQEGVLLIRQQEV